MTYIAGFGMVTVLALLGQACGCREFSIRFRIAGAAILVLTIFFGALEI